MDRANYNNPERNRRSEQNRKFTRFLICNGGDAKWISLKDHRKLKEVIKTTNGLLSVQNISENDLWIKGANPDNLGKEIEKVQQINTNASNLAEKLTTTEHESMKTLLSSWQEDSSELMTLVKKLSKEDNVLQSEAHQALQILAPKVQSKIKEWEENKLIDTSSDIYKYVEDYKMSQEVLYLDANDILQLHPGQQGQQPIASNTGENDGDLSHSKARASHDTNRKSPEQMKAYLPELCARLEFHFKTMSEMINVYEPTHSRLRNAIKTAQEVCQQISAYVNENNKDQYWELRNNNDRSVEEFSADRDAFDSYTKNVELSLPPKLGNAQASPKEIGQRIEQELSEKADQLEKRNTKLQNQFESFKEFFLQTAQSKNKGAIKINNAICDQIVHYYKWINEIKQKYQGKIGNFDPETIKYHNKVLTDCFDKKASIEKLIGKYNNTSTQRDIFTPQLWNRFKDLRNLNSTLPEHLKDIREQLGEQLAIDIQRYMEEIKEQKIPVMKHLEVLLEPQSLAESVNKLVMETDTLLYMETDTLLNQIRKDLKEENVPASDPLEWPKKMTGHFDSLAVISKELGEKLKKLKENLKPLALSLGQKYSDNRWTSDYILQILGSTCSEDFDRFNHWYEQNRELVKDEGTAVTRPQDEKGVEKPFDALERLPFKIYKGANNIAKMIALKEARIAFKEEGRDSKAVREAMEAFQPPKHLILDHEINAMDKWIRLAIKEIKDSIMKKAINNDKITETEIEQRMGSSVNNKKFKATISIEESVIGGYSDTEDETDTEEKYENNKRKKTKNKSYIEFEIEDMQIKLERSYLEKCLLGKYESLRGQLDDEKGVKVIKKYCELFLEALDQKARDLIKNAHMFIRYQPETVGKILKDRDPEYPELARKVLDNLKIQTVESQEAGLESQGKKGRRSKSQFETLTSGGAIGLEARANNDYGRSGIPKNMVPDMRFVYGYWSDDFYGELNSAKGYGPVIGKVKKELKKIALVTLYNSLNMSDGNTYLAIRSMFADKVNRHCFGIVTHINPLEINSLDELKMTPEFQIPALWLSEIEGFIVPTSDNPEFEKMLNELRDELAAEDLLIRPYSGPFTTKLTETASKEPFLPEELTNLLKQDPGLMELYKKDAGVWEKYTLEQHTQMVMGQFEKYFAAKWDSRILTKGEFRLMLALHDIGKPEAIKKTGDKSNQHEYTRDIVSSILKEQDVSGENASVIVSLATHDYIGGKYLQKKQSPEEVARQIADEAVHLRIGIEDYFQLVTIYFKCDAGAYTADAEDASGKKGKEALDSLFKFHYDDKDNPTMEFSSKTQSQFDILAGCVESEAATRLEQQAHDE